MGKTCGATVPALAIGAVSAVLIGIPIAALIWFALAWFFGVVAFGAHPGLALFSAYFALIWGFYFMWPSSLVLGALGGVIALKLAHRLQGSEFMVGVAGCGASLGALNGAWAGLGTDKAPLIVGTLAGVGAIAGALTGLIAGLIIRKVCGTESVASNA